jgi:hypothetical protein
MRYLILSLSFALVACAATGSSDASILTEAVAQG